MLDTQNTKDGRYIFVVTYSDGTKLTESDCYWDAVPTTKPIKSLAVYDVRESKTLVELEGFTKFFFSNEALSCQSNDWRLDTDSHIIIPNHNFLLTAKIVGGVTQGGATEIRIDVRGDVPVGTKTEYPEAQTPFAVHVFRPGIGQDG